MNGWMVSFKDVLALQPSAGVTCDMISESCLMRYFCEWNRVGGVLQVVRVLVCLCDGCWRDRWFDCGCIVRV